MSVKSNRGDIKLTPETAELIGRLVRRITDAPYDGNIALNATEWDWPSGVGMYGMFRAWKAAGDPRYLAFLKSWVDAKLPEADLRRNVNVTAPMLTVMELHKATGEVAYLTACRQAADWLILEAPRTREGGLEHTVSDRGVSFREQMWADTLFMACIFLARMGEWTKEPAYSEEAAKQLRIHAKHLRDERTGLFYHAWNGERRDWMSGALWGRANAWMIAGGMEMLELLPENFEGRGELAALFLRHADALQSVQRENGMFGTLLDHRDSYDEASATAGIAYGLKRGIRSGLLPDRLEAAAVKAERAVMDRINERGELEQVSHGTDVKRDLEDYKKVPIVPAFWGQGLALLLLSER